MTTRAQHYAAVNGGQWRTARVPHRCDWKRDGWRCRHEIAPGQKYFDTKLHNPASSSAFGTYRICETCANEEIKL